MDGLDTMKNLVKIIKYSLSLLIILTLVNTYFCSIVQVDVKLDSEVVNIQNKTEFYYKLFQPKEERRNVSELFRERVRHLGRICNNFKDDIPGVR